MPQRARIIGHASHAQAPGLFTTAPVPAAQKLLDKIGWDKGSVDLWEVNEAFASVVLAWAEELNAPMDRVNPNGGAIAMGHPLGATGAVLMTKIVHELERTGGRYGLQTMCIGYGQGTATIIERMEG